MYNFNIAKDVIRAEAQALLTLADNLPYDFIRLLDYIMSFNGKIVLTGIGKSGYIARKIAATLSSTGTCAVYIHPAEASHGDLGMISKQDLVIMLSTSGATKELIDIVNYCKKLTIKMVAMTMKPSSTLAQNSDFLLNIPEIKEASSIGAPTTSSLMMLALGDALAISIQEMKTFSKDDYHLLHPGGKIGLSLLRVKDIMRDLHQLPLVLEHTSFSDTILIMNDKGLGCAVVIDDQSRLIGIISDGDLRRHINEDLYSKFAKDVMTIKPIQVSSDLLVSEALALMKEKLVTILPVVEESRLIGAIHIHDILKVGLC